MNRKKNKRDKKCVIKRNLKLRDYKICLKASQIENIINYLEKKEIDPDSLKEITKCEKVILKTQQQFKVKEIIFLLKKLTRLL